MTSPERPQGVRLLVSLACCAAVMSTVLATASGAQAATPTGWRGYVEGPRTASVRPVAATVLSGHVHNPRGLVGKGVTILTVRPGDAPATVLLDFGKDVEGLPFINVKSYTNNGASPSLQLTFSETRKYLFSPGSSTLATAVAAGARTVTVEDASTFAVGDRVKIGTVTDRIVAVSGTTLTLAHPLPAAVAAGASVTSTPGALTADTRVHSPSR